MGKEIERKFLINYAMWLELEKPQGKVYRQGYLSTDPTRTIRVRVTDASGFLTIKGISIGASRAEYEYEIPRQDATELLNNFSVSELLKTRYKIIHDHKIWEVDVFSGDNTGLIVAEIELTAEDEYFTIPGWVDKEVTGQEKYYNSNLTVLPYKNWIL